MGIIIVTAWNECAVISELAMSFATKHQGDKHREAGFAFSDVEIKSSAEVPPLILSPAKKFIAGPKFLNDAALIF